MEDETKVGDKVKNVGYDVNGGPPLGSLGTVVAPAIGNLIGIKWDKGRYGLVASQAYHLHTPEEIALV